MQIRIGNQTSGHVSGQQPYQFALAQKFDAFEWFSDKKGITGWSEADTPATSRRELRKAAEERDIRFSVHAPCLADPVSPRGQVAIRTSIEFARDIGGAVVNFHLFAVHPARVYVDAMLPLIREAAQAGVALSLENTPEISPDYVNAVFGVLSAIPEAKNRVGFCFDMGHANLHTATRHRYVEYLDLLGDHVPINHWHAHENWGDRDSHLPLFSGPASKDDRGIRGLIRRLQKRNFSGSVVLEQWPTPPEMLVHARNRLRTLWAEIAREESRPLVTEPTSRAA
jgi:sugar phosphate isomerase/epimerase